MYSFNEHVGLHYAYIQRRIQYLVSFGGEGALRVIVIGNPTNRTTRVTKWSLFCTPRFGPPAFNYVNDYNSQYKKKQ